MKRHFGDPNQNAEERVEAQNAEFEELKKQINAELVQNGHTQVNPDLLTTAAHLMWRGDYDDALDAYERAGMMARDEVYPQHQQDAGDHDIPF